MTTSAGTNTATADAMFASAATTISHLLGKEVTAGATEYTESNEAMRLDVGWLVTVAEVPAGSLKFFVRFDSETLTKMVGVMMGGETADAGSSMTGEIAAQIVSTMAGELATRLGHDSQGITAVVCDDAKMLPQPPFHSYLASVDVEGAFAIPMAIDFDALAAARVGLIEEQGAEMSGNQPSATAQQPQATQVQAPQSGDKSPQAVSFTKMTPNVDQLMASGGLDMVHDVPMQVRALLGGAVLPLRDIVSMQSGSIFELDQTANEPIDLYVNNVLIARGQVVVVDERFAVKISELNPTPAVR
jgi:flagellar motor switch protein FliN